ncbi:sodium:proton antiporter [Thermoleptolyngbya sp. C42_A2020_037]|uniref:cation:proton antiporter n=1 Tax=Thermoleptolyngbya sp. C42_A2020_037 TaxID=2747799 RepID=UPI0019F6E617|nr:sodium:proton antiporter [Thermoleptolyngbya sp. C42_A2020_037]MBF2083031.1 cation:proton antiporter [Thermoleptolyngbya sp. C42_A2020_037]
MIEGLSPTPETPLALMLQFVIAVLAGISGQVVAAFFNVPSIVFLLIFGIVLGGDGLDWLHPQSLGVGLEVIVALSVALILFEGGLNLELRQLNTVSGSLRNLVTLGTLITLLGGGMAAHWLGEFPWAIAFLYASLVVVTGPTVISPLMKQVQVDRQVSSLLEGEGVLIDPVGAILAVVVLDVILNGNAAPLSVASGLLLRLGIGGGIGALGGWLLGQFLKQAKFLSEGQKNLVVLAGVWGLFGLAQSIRSESGLMTVVLAGLVLRASSIPDERLLRRFKEQLTILAVSILFVLLAADLSIASLFALGWGAGLTVLALMFVVRPLNVAVCTWNSGLNWRQKLFMCWVAPRGIVSASVASLFAILLTQRGISGGEAIKALVFLTILSTVFLQGLTARWVAEWLDITSKQATGAVIVGCNPLSLLIGRMFQERGESVVLIDTDLAACKLAEQEGLRAIASSALDTDVLEQAGLGRAGTFLALTSNGQVNQVLAQRAAEEFQPPRVLAVVPGDLSQESEPVAIATSAASASTTSPASPKVQPAFVPKMPLKTWNRYLEDRDVRLGETVLQEPILVEQQVHLATLIADGKLMPLLVERDGQLQVASTEVLQEGDRLLYLWHNPKSKMLKRLGGSNPNARLMPERIAEVETLPQPSVEIEQLLSKSIAAAPVAEEVEGDRPDSTVPVDTPDDTLDEIPNAIPNEPKGETPQAAADALTSGIAPDDASEAPVS